MTDPLLTFVHLSDTHLQADSQTTLSGFRNASTTTAAVVDAINALEFQIQFVLHTGDVGNDPGGAQDYAQAKLALSAIHVPVQLIPGNHDAPEWLYSAFSRPVSPGYFSFVVNGVKFICLNSNVKNAGHGGLGPDQLAWLGVQLNATPDMPVVVALHHHPFPLGAPMMDSLMLSDGEALHSLLKGSKARISCVLFGHIHETVVYARDGITYASVQSAWYQLKTWPGLGEFYRDPVQTSGFNVVSIMPDGMAIIRVFRVPLEP